MSLILKKHRCAPNFEAEYTAQQWAMLPGRAEWDPQMDVVQRMCRCGSHLTVSMLEDKAAISLAKIYAEIEFRRAHARFELAATRYYRAQAKLASSDFDAQQHEDLAATAMQLGTNARAKLHELHADALRLESLVMSSWRAAAIKSGEVVPLHPIEEPDPATEEQLKTWDEVLGP